MADRSFLSWPFFDEAHRELAGRLEPWVAEQLAPLIEEHHHGGDVDAIAGRMVTKLAEGGWLAYCVPDAFGGRFEHLNVRSICLVRETLARYSGLADVAFAMQGLGSAPISLFGTPTLKRKYLPDVAAGQRICAFALSEPNAGSDPGALETTARPDGDHYVIDGVKTWISNAGLAHQYVVFARTGEGPGHKGLSAFVVERDAPGLTLAEKIPVIAPHPLGTLRFENCRLARSDMLGKPGEGFKVAMATLDVFRPTVGAAALGFARRALDEALARVSRRVIGGNLLSSYQMTQAKLADMALAVDAAALLVYRAAWTKDVNGGGVTREASMAKLYATESAQQVIDQAVQLFGGLGVVSGVPVERLYREIRALRIYEGTSEMQKLIIAGHTLRRCAEEATGREN
ncbi:MAG: acyl-CoA dehydrogenase family protein [Alphaproteobacteria bacterium]